jgi:hypothetical protein
LCSHSDLVQGTILYIQTDLTTSADDFELAVYDVHNVQNGLKVKVVVKPRLQKPNEPFKVNSVNRGPTVIGLNNLDASELKVSAVRQHSLSSVYNQCGFSIRQRLSSYEVAVTLTI